MSRELARSLSFPLLASLIWLSACADGDGDLDLYFVNGARLGTDGEVETASGGPVNRLFLQQGDGRFVDATEGSGLGDPGYGTGVAVGDFDNDGAADV